MATKKKRKRAKTGAKRKHARKHAANPAKRRRARKRHAVSAAPKRRRRSNPKRSHARRVRRAHVAAPRRHRRKNPGKRRHRRNPGIPMWAIAGAAAALGLAGYALANDGSFAITQRTDPTGATLSRNRYIAGAVLTGSGLILAAFASPVLGAGLAAGGLAALAGTQLSLALGHVLDKKNPDGSLVTFQPAAAAPAAPAVTAPSIKGIFTPGGQQRIGAVFSPSGQQHIGAVFADCEQHLGDYFGG